jgi:hypothetical protein
MSLRLTSLEIGYYGIRADGKYQGKILMYNPETSGSVEVSLTPSQCETLIKDINYTLYNEYKAATNLATYDDLLMPQLTKEPSDGTQDRDNSNTEGKDEDASRQQC